MAAMVVDENGPVKRAGFALAQISEAIFFARRASDAERAAPDTWRTRGVLGSSAPSRCGSG
jgi:hypothetical protein